MTRLSRGPSPSAVEKKKKKLPVKTNDNPWDFDARVLTVGTVQKNRRAVPHRAGIR